MSILPPTVLPPDVGDPLADLPRRCGICGRRRVLWPNQPWLYRDALGSEPCLTTEDDQ